jgi:hypothetical protein
MLFDFYGELLTERQREAYHLYYNEDLSLTEIGEMRGTTRQAVWDMIRHADAAMKEMEEKTGLIERFLHTKEELEDIVRLLKAEKPEEAVPHAAEKLDVLIGSL